MINMVKEFDINLTTAQDCEFVLDVVNNTKATCELYSNYYDGGDHISCLLYVDSDGYEELLNKFPVFEHISYEDYKLDEESNDLFVRSKKSVTDVIYELKDIYARLEKIVDEYNVEPQD